MANYNDKNNKILAALNEIGQRVFSSLTGLNYGTYTARELANANQSKNNKRNVKFDDIADGNEIERVNVDTFSLEFRRSAIFEIIARAETLPGLTPNSKANFVRESKAYDPDMVFYATFTKEHKKLVKLAGSDEQHPAMMKICLDPSKGVLVVTDTRELVISAIEIDANGLDLSGKQFLIDPSQIKNLIGKCKIYADDPRDFLIENEAGQIYTNTNTEIGRYPAYERVLPKVASCGHIRFTKDGVKELVSFAKLAIRTDKSDIVPLRLSVEYGSDVAKLEYNNYNQQSSTINVSLEAPAKCTFAIGINAPLVVKTSGVFDGGMWVTSNSRPIVIDCKHTLCGLIMPVKIDNPKEIAATGDALIPALERFNTSESEINECENEIYQEVLQNELREARAAYMPMLYNSDINYNAVLSFVDWLQSFVESISQTLDIVLQHEISEKIREIKKLAALAGLPVEALIGMLSDPEKDETPTAIIEDKARDIAEISESPKINVPVAFSEFARQIVCPKPQNVSKLAVCAKFAVTGGRAVTPVWRPRRFRAPVSAAAVTPGRVSHWTRYRNNNCRIRDGTIDFITPYLLHINYFY